jgi:hypothetical protein
VYVKIVRSPYANRQRVRKAAAQKKAASAFIYLFRIYLFFGMLKSTSPSFHHHQSIDNNQPTI